MTKADLGANGPLGLGNEKTGSVTINSNPGCGAFTGGDLAGTLAHEILHVEGVTHGGISNASFDFWVIHIDLSEAGILGYNAWNNAYILERFLTPCGPAGIIAYTEDIINNTRV